MKFQRILTCATIALCGVTAGVPNPFTQPDNTCPDKSTCAADSTCCPDEDGSDYQCCKTTNVPVSQGGTCCGGGCCTDSETCCGTGDSSVCCLQQNSYCVQAKPQNGFPSRCCPRWTVDCNTGTVGCCDPAQPYQWTISEPTKKIPELTKKIPGKFQPTSTVSTAAGRVAYALVIGGGRPVATALLALQIDVASGKVLSKTPVKGFVDDPAGETTREFLWDQSRKLFYYFDANFTADGGVRPATGRVTYLITVDPIKATAVQTVIKGATDFPTGYAMDESTGSVIMATQLIANDEFTGYTYYTVDPTTSVATKIGSLNRGTSEDDANYYAGYYRGASADGSTTFRLGYKYVSTQSNQGLGSTIPKAGSSTWKSELSQGHDFFMTLSLFNNNTYLSLAPNKNDTARGLDLVQWSEDESVYRTIAKLGNAHPPRAYGGGDLGYLADSVSAKKDLWVSLVVIEGNDKYQIEDHYGIASFDFSGGSPNATVAPLQPRDIAGTWSISGLGI